MNSGIDVKVRIVNDEEGFFIAKAVGYPGVIAFARNEEDVMARIKEAWFAMSELNKIKNIGKSRTAPHRGDATEKSLRLQFA